MRAELINICNNLIKNCKNNTLLYSDITSSLTKEDAANYYIVSSMLEYIADKDITVIIPETGSIYDEEVKDSRVQDEFDKSIAADGIKWYLNSINFGLLTAEEEKELARRIKQGDMKAREKMITYNLKLVVNIAKRYCGKNKTLDFSDLIQAGNIGLMKAVDKFDPSLDYKFSTYATWWIRQSITRAMSDEGRNIRMPVHALDQYRYIKRAINELEYQNINPTYEQIANYVNERGWIVGSTTRAKLTPKDIKRYIQQYNNTDTISLQTPIGDEEDSFIGDFIADDSIDIEHKAEISNLHESIDQILNLYLSEREANVLIKRYGLDGSPPMTLEQIAKIYGLTRERIRQIEEKAKRKVKRRAIQMHLPRDF